MSYDCSCDYDAPQFYWRRQRSARKPRRCEECAGHILPGDRYEYVSGKWDGHIGSFTTCQHCHDIRQWVQNNVPCFCWAHGNLDEDAKGAVDDACYRAPLETAGLRFGLARRLVRRRQFNQTRRP